MRKRLKAHLVAGALLIANINRAGRIFAHQNNRQTWGAFALGLALLHLLADALQALLGNFFAVDDLSRHGVAFVVVKRKAHYRIFTNGFTNSGNEAA